jgi:hypothetical protein
MPRATTSCGAFSVECALGTKRSVRKRKASAMVDGRMNFNIPAAVALPISP